MIDIFNNSNKIIIYKDYMNDIRVNSVSTPEGDEQCKGLTNTNLKNYTYNMYASDESTDVNKLLKGSDISVATPRSITIQCSMPSDVANAKYTHARVSGANLKITWPNGQNTIQPIPGTWVRGFKGLGISQKQTYFDFLTPSLCDGCKVSITNKSSNTGLNLNVITISLATDANGTDSIIADSSYIIQPQLITSNISKIVLFTAKNNEGGDIIVTPKRNITVELRCSSANYYSVEITSMPTYSAIGSSITGNILFEPSYSNIQINQLLSTRVFSVDDGDYNIVFSALKAIVRSSKYASAQTVAVRPSPGNITITKGDTTTYKVVYDLGMPDIIT